MAIVAPFKGLMYNYTQLGDVASLVAPPYDVISEEEQANYYRIHPYNVIRLILSKSKIGDSDWDNRYTRAADIFKRWQSEDALIQSPLPSMYLTSLTFDPGDGAGPKTRWGLITLVRIEEEGSGVVLPHERTFSAHKDDRLRLMRACSAQLSQIFGLYGDHEDRIFNLFKEVAASPPYISFQFRDGTGHKMWIVQEPEIFQALSREMQEKAVFIADGHHRYETARTYRDMMRTRHGMRPSQRSYEYVMMYLTNMDDRGLTILPSHRLIKKYQGFETARFLEKVKRWFDVSAMPLEGIDLPIASARLKAWLEDKGKSCSAIGFYPHEGQDVYLLSLKPGARKEMGDDLPVSLKELDVLVLSRLILQRIMGFTKEALDDEKTFHYQSDMFKAFSMVESGLYQLAFILNPTRIQQVREVAGNGLIMPRKSTYFYPKVITGLVFNTIDPHEIIQVY